MMQNKPAPVQQQQVPQNKSPYSTVAMPSSNNNMANSNAGMNGANNANKGVKTLPSIKENYSTGIKLQEVNGASGRQLQVDTLDPNKQSTLSDMRLGPALPYYA